VNKRLALPLILVSGFLLLVFAWQRVKKDATTADLTLAAVSQPRSEVVVSGYVKNSGAAPFSLETLQIEEPGKEPYRRQVSLDADNRFELTLGKPMAGTYRVSVRTRKANGWKGAQEGWLKMPDLVLAGDPAPLPQMVKARDYDYQRLLLWGAVFASVGVVLLLICVRQWPKARDAQNA
jgi:hypothetical protein